MTQEKINIVSEKILNIIADIDTNTVNLDVRRFLDVITDLEMALKNEFGDYTKLEDKEVADVLEFLEHYELPYRLQKKFGLMQNGISVLDVVKNQNAFSAKLYGLKIGRKTSYFKSKNDLVEILSGKLRNLKIDKVEFNVDQQEMIFVAKMED